MLQVKIFEAPVAKYYMVAAFFTNLRTCFYGNQMASYFDCDCLSLDAYLALIDVHDDLSELV